MGISVKNAETETGADVKASGEHCDHIENDIVMKGDDESKLLRDEVLDHVAAINDTAGIHFKSQQLGEPELNVSEKRRIAETLLDRSHNIFLSRFGHRLLDHHLSYFENATSDKSQRDIDEIKYQIDRLRKVKRGSRAFKVIYTSLFSKSENI